MRPGSPAVVVLFFAALWTPLVGAFFGAGQFRPADENRYPIQPPKGLAARAFTAYFHDHFGFRGTLITAHGLLRVKLLGVSSSPDVLLGRQGWLYYAGEQSMENYRGALPFHAGELAAWVRFFECQRDWLARRNILFMAAIIPDKQTVYPEFLPRTIRKVTGRTRLDELMAIPEASVLDLRSAMREAKARHTLYYKTDTHWAAPGVYAAHREILLAMARTYPGLAPKPYIEPGQTGNYTAGDLTKMLGLGSVWREIPETSQPDPQPSAPLPLRVLMIGDSFLPPLAALLAPHFAYTAVLPSGVLTPELVNAKHPNVVLVELVERKLNAPPPHLDLPGGG